MHTFSCNMESNHFWICSCMENCTILDQFPLQFRCIDQISIMSQRQSSLYIRQNQGLRIFSNRSSCCRISYMTNSNVSWIFTHYILAKHLTYQSKILVELYISSLSSGIWNCQSTWFLSSVLQGSQSIIYGGNHISSIQIINAKHATFFFYSSHLISPPISIIFVYCITFHSAIAFQNMVRTFAKNLHSKL